MAADIVNKYINSRNPHHMSTKMGGRTVEIKPVGAWVYPERIIPTPELSAVVSAEVEERRIRQNQIDKELKLKHFQEEVRKRVQKLESIKRQQQLESSCKAIENERNIIKQSTLAAEKNTSRKNSCTLRAYAKDLAIRNSGNHSGKHALSVEQQEDQQFQEQISQVRKYTSAARNKLISRRVMADDYGRDNLPGGTWQGSDKDLSVHTNRDTRAGDHDRQGEDVHSERSVQFDTDRLLQEIRRVKSTHRTKSGRSIASRGSVDSRLSVISVPDIYPGVQNEDEKVQSVQQRAMYRRLFMDIEREQVREAQRRKTHSKKMHELKKDKEEERKKIEFASLKLNEPSETSQAEITRELLQQERLELEQTRLDVQRKQQRGVETGRFLEALKQTLREKMSKRSIELPALCCCGETIWDTSPDTCANNCVFYKNPKAFAKALQCVLASCDAV